ncbi:peptidase T [Aquirufa nivalisilvae]|uniref:Peptidase T n=1 Tax=Aquirufa nivalisilvae TaxID=2516557 RepID=A0A2S2DW06_9BACT|nr:peptidase T [Aquirufa nivalisilvae]AWL08977.1 Tripeptide aminopeptidase [Aquirufa nivalisilvae]MCZ2480781.1 peptidase T [Aquirufa nivalisilvae]MCZ2482097.1 peptidase T [Aquirufa nivalisilvae]
MTNISQIFQKYTYSSAQRFLTYVQIDTQSDPNSSSSPTTEKQKDLGKVLVQELKQLGIDSAHMDEYGYVYALVPSNIKQSIPGLCFCAHMDTSPDCSGKDVKPIIHQNYQGQDLVLPDDPSVIIRLSEHPDLAEQMGHDIVTASGKTLLGADNKAGVAEIMDAVQFWVQHPDVPHGPISILFTPDEEVGRGTDHVNLEKVNAQYGYTIDGEKRGHLENETFSADGFTISIEGISQHPGFAKGRMESAIKIASEIVNLLPKDHLSPESTEKMEGFIHPVEISGSVETATIDFILRDFKTEKLQEYGDLLKDITHQVLINYPHSKVQFKQTEQYRNMNEILINHPACLENAMEAMKRAGLQPEMQSIRGGTDGSRLTFMGLPCPNLFAGEHAFHSKQEWVSIQDMQKATETIVHLAAIYAEKGT